MYRRLPLHLVISLLAVDLVAFAVLVRGMSHPDHRGELVAAAGLSFGAMAALCERTWGIGLVLAAATSFFAAAAMHMGPPTHYVVAAIGVLPFVFTMKHMVRFHLGATVLFALLAGGMGTAFQLVAH